MIVLDCIVLDHALEHPLKENTLSAFRVSTRRNRCGHLRLDHTSGNNVDQSKIHAPFILRRHTRTGSSTVPHVPPKASVMTHNKHRTNLVRTERVIRKDVKAPGVRVASPSRGCDLLRGNRESDHRASVHERTTWMIRVSPMLDAAGRTRMNPHKSTDHTSTT